MRFQIFLVALLLAGVIGLPSIYSSFISIPIILDTQDYFPGTETANKGSVSGAAFPGAIQTSDDSYRTPQEANQAPSDTNHQPDTDTQVKGTKISGTFPDDINTNEGTSITYREANQAPAQTLAFDSAAEFERTLTTDPQTWSHDPVGTPRAIVVTIGHGTESTDCIVSVTYQGTTMSRIQTNTDTLNEPGRSYVYFLGSSVPTNDPATVSADIAATGACSTTDMHFASLSFTAGNDVTVIDNDGIDNNIANPSRTMQYVSRESISVMVLYSGVANVLTDATPNCSGSSACTAVNGFDIAAFGVRVDRQTTRGSTDQVMGYTSANDDVAFSVISFTQTDSTADFEIEIKYDWTSESCSSATKRLTINAWHTNTEDILVQVYDENEASPTTRLTITATADGTTLTYDLSNSAPNEWDGGNPNIRFIGNTESGDSTQTDLLADWVVIQCLYPPDYEVEVKYDWTGVDTSGDSWALHVECKRVTAPENLLIQIVDSTETTWTTRYTCDQNTDTLYNSYSLSTDELDSGSPNIRVIDIDQSDEGSQSTWDLDLIKIVRTYTPTNSPPTITLYGVLPTSGPYSASWAFFATYTDSDNDAPTYFRLEIVSVSNRTMTENNTGDTVYTDGKAYYLNDASNTYCPNVYSFFFSTSNAFHSIRTTPSSSFTVTNTAPSINNEGGAPTTVVHGNSYSYDLNADDIDVPNCQSFTWSKQSGPSWLSVNPSSGLISGNAPDDLSQGGNLVARVSDSVTFDEVSISITITNVAPTFTSGEQVSEEIITGDYLHDYNVAEIDPNDYVYFTMETNNTELFIGPTNGTIWGTLTITGTFYVNVTVHDQAIPNGTDWNNYTLVVTVLTIQPSDVLIVGLLFFLFIFLFVVGLKERFAMVASGIVSIFIGLELWGMIENAPLSGVFIFVTALCIAFAITKRE